LKDCLDIHKETGNPIVFDTLHHECLNHNETMQEALSCSTKTWAHNSDGNPIIDYSSQSMGERKGKHAKTIDKNHFIMCYKELDEFIRRESIDLDVMLEIKDKENSAILSLGFIK
jgi:UV DNA damage endonuclease